MDGDSVACVDYNFVNIAESPVGFGHTGPEAFKEYCIRAGVNMFAAFDGDDLISFGNTRVELTPEEKEGLQIVEGKKLESEGT